MSDLTLPGDIPGLLRRGSPSPHKDGNAVVCAVRANGSVLVHVNTPFQTGGVRTWSCSPRELALDLTDATGRAHAVWWVAVHGAYLLPKAAYGARWVHNRGEREWCLEHPEERVCEVYETYADDRRNRVKALADLDPDDPRTLPDGSRWVDAEALRLVVLHVAGRADV